MSASMQPKQKLNGSKANWQIMAEGSVTMSQYLEMQADREKWKAIAHWLEETSTCKITSHFLKGCPYDCEYRKAVRQSHES